MLYRKYRPTTFEEVVGQPHVVLTLKGALISGRVGHAFLFAGPRGTGKTTVARVFARAINCIKRLKDGNPCGECDSCQAVKAGRSLDLIEIDAASNRGIDEIRSVRDSASVASMGGGSKVFLIDEVHMLSKDAFNALLKTLEEPPEHVIFILATTEAHKILPTVLSRVQRFDFKKISPADIAEKLTRIAKDEKVKINADAIMAMAMSSDGAMRDAEVSFTKVLASIPRDHLITLEDINELLGLVPFNYYPEFLGYLVRQDRAAALDCVNRVYSSGHDLEHFTKDFLAYLRKILITKISPATLVAVGQDLAGEHADILSAYAQQLDGKTLVRFLNAFTQARADMKHSPIPQLPLELAVMEIMGNN